MHITKCKDKGRTESQRNQTRKRRKDCTEPRRPCDSAGIIFDPLSLVCIAGEAAHVLPQGAQLSQQLSICRPEKLPGNALPTWDREEGTRNRLLARAEGNDGSRHPISRSGLCDLLTVAGIIKQKRPSTSSCGSS